MPVSNYTQWVIPIGTQTGGRNSGRLIRLVINRDNFDYNIDPTDQFILDPSVFVVKNIAPHIMEYAEDDALVTVDMAYVELLDTYVFRGTVDGTPSGDLDLQPEGKTLIWKHICDADRLTIWKEIELADGSFEKRFCGDVNPRELERIPFSIEYEKTEDENPLSLIRFPAKSMQDRLAKTTVRDFLRSVTVADLTGTADPKPLPFYGGIQVINQAFKDELNKSDKDSNWNEEIDEGTFTISTPTAIIADPAPNTITLSGGTFSIATDDPVRFMLINGRGSLPGGIESGVTYYALDGGPTFQVSLTVGGAAVDITAAGAFAYCMKLGHGTSIDQDVFFKRFAYTGKLSGPDTFPAGMWGISIDKIIELICALPQIDYQYTTPSEDEHSLAFGEAVWNETTDSYDTVWDDPVTLITDLYANFNTLFNNSPNPGFFITAVDTTADDIVCSGQAIDFTDGDIVNFRVTDGVAMPVPLETFTDYYVVNHNVGTGHFQVSDSLGGSPIDLTTTGTGGATKVSKKFQLDTPCGYKWDTPLETVLKDICLLLGFVLEFEIDQDTGQPILKLSRRRYTTGTVPDWKYIENTGSEKRRESKAKAVKTQYVADLDSMTCPRRNEKDIYDVPLRLRIHSWADDKGIVHHRNIRYDSQRPLWEQSLTWWDKDDRDISVAEWLLHEDGWVGGCQLYGLKTTSDNDHYPPAWDNDALHPDSDTDYEGFYVKHRVRYRDQEKAFDSMLPLMALYYANELLHPDDIIEVERDYGGIVDDSGSILTVKPRMTATLGDREYRVLRLEQRELEAKTKLKLLPVPSNVDELDLTLPLFEGKGGGRATGGGGGGGSNTSTSSNTTDNGAYVAIMPTTPIRNRIKPDVGIVNALDIGNALDGEVTELGFLDEGEVSRHAFKAPAAFDNNLIYLLPETDPTAAQVLSASAPSGGVVTLSWEDGADLDDAVIKGPATANRNRIQPTADAVEALALKKRSSSTANLFNIYDETDTPRITVDDDFDITIDTGSITIGGTGGGSISVTGGDGGPTLSLTQETLGDDVSLWTSPATNDDPLVRFKQSRVTTTDATGTAIYSWDCSVNDRIYMISADVLGRRTGGSAGTAGDGAGYEIKVVAKNVGGTLTILNQAIMFMGESQAGWFVIFNVNGENLELKVTGATNNNVTWHMPYSRFSYMGS